MNHKLISIDELRPDPNQPRKSFDEKAIEEMAVSIKHEGIINDIEVDINHVIITGEQRWRAAKKAGLKEVPVKVIPNISEKDRFIRQVHENLHHNTMSALDTALALDKIRGWILSSAAELKQKRHGGFRYGHPGLKELHDLLGKSIGSLSDYLDLLGETGVIKEALKDPTFQMSKIASIKGTPEKYRDQLKDLVATQKDISRDTVRHIREGLKRAYKYDEDAAAQKLLRENYEGRSVIENLRRINKIVPVEEARVKEPADAVKFAAEKIVELMELLDDHSLKSLDDFHRPLMEKNINALGFYLQSYLQGKDMKDLKIDQVKLLN